MLLSSRLPLTALVSLCQAFRMGLSAGLSLVDVFRQQERKGPLVARPIIGRMAGRMERGESLEDVLKDEGKHFPPMFVGMAIVGEQAGGLPEIFRELERYFREQLTLRRQFLAEITWPVIQLVGAIGVITLLILILGMLPTQGSKPFDPLGFGVGVPGALRFLGCVALFFGGIAALYFFTTRVLRQKAAVHRFLLAVPGIGGCIRAIAMTRFCLALHLTLETSISLPKALRHSFRATGNGAFEACADSAANAVKGGAEVAEAFERCHVFTEEFVQITATAEESGQLPEVMARQAEQYQELASLQLRVLNRIGSFSVWAFIAILIIIFIFRIASVYLGILDNAGSTDLSKPLY
jgi:type II secretory pathway component PulF